MTPLRTILATLFALIATAGSAPADFINPGFETGNLSGWAAAGDALVVTSSIGVAPRAGTYQALLTTASRNGDLNNFSGTDAVTATTLESFLGLASGTLGSGFEGSALKQVVIVNAGDVLTFNYKFLKTEGAAADFAFVTLNGYGPLADTTTGPFSPSAVVLDPVFGDPTQETGWRTYSHTFAAGGAYTLGIGVADANDEFNPSALLLDNGQLGPTAVNAVPAPGGLLLLALGGITCLLGQYRRRRPAPNPQSV